MSNNDLRTSNNLLLCRILITLLLTKGIVGLDIEVSESVGMAKMYFTNLRREHTNISANFSGYGWSQILSLPCAGALYHPQNTPYLQRRSACLGSGSELLFSHNSR